MPYISPERIGAPAFIDDEDYKEDSCRFAEEDLFNIVDDLGELNELPTISANDLLSKIKNKEPIDYDHVIIDGDFDIRKLNLDKDKTGFFIINSPIKIRHSLFCGKIYLATARFEDCIDFLGSLFGNDVYFYESKMDCPIFQQSIFNGVANFRDTEFISNAYFNYSIFYGDANFYRAKVGGFAAFNWAQFLGTINWGDATFKGDSLNFYEAKFKDPSAQEASCRRAKTICETRGNRELASYYFYREMEAKRIQKGIFSMRCHLPPNKEQSIRSECYLMIKSFLWYNVLEYIIVQKIFGYGVHPKRLIGAWGAIVLGFFLIYQFKSGITISEGWFGWLKFSFGTAIAPGYIASISSPGSIGYKLSPLFQVAAMIEAVAGMFLWTGFIATFARKYMR